MTNFAVFNQHFYCAINAVRDIFAHNDLYPVINMYSKCRLQCVSSLHNAILLTTLSKFS
jgi:hypothetical protein